MKMKRKLLRIKTKINNKKLAKETIKIPIGCLVVETSNLHWQKTNQKSQFLIKFIANKIQNSQNNQTFFTEKLISFNFFTNAEFNF